MTENQQQVRDWMKAFGQDTPDKPIIPSLEVRKLRAKLILEEALETIEALGFCLWEKKTEDVMRSGLHRMMNRIKDFEFHEMSMPDESDKEGKLHILKSIADGCEDLKVVTEGTLVACGLVNKNTVSERQGYDPLFDEVMRSNWSKFWTEKEMEYETNKTTQSIIFERKELNPDVERPWIGRDANGKVIKSPSYSPANLQPIINEMSK